MNFVMIKYFGIILFSNLVILLPMLRCSSCFSGACGRQRLKLAEWLQFVLWSGILSRSVVPEGINFVLVSLMFLCPSVKLSQDVG